MGVVGYLAFSLPPASFESMWRRELDSIMLEICAKAFIVIIPVKNDAPFTRID